MISLIKSHMRSRHRRPATSSVRRWLFAILFNKNERQVVNSVSQRSRRCLCSDVALARVRNPFRATDKSESMPFSLASNMTFITTWRETSFASQTCSCDGGPHTWTSHTISVTEKRSMLHINFHIFRDASCSSTDSKSISRLDRNDDFQQGS
jgi:hypothetical protein